MIVLTICQSASRLGTCMQDTLVEYAISEEERTTVLGLLHQMEMA